MNKVEEKASEIRGIDIRVEAETDQHPLMPTLHMPRGRQRIWDRLLPPDTKTGAVVLAILVAAAGLMTAHNFSLKPEERLQIQTITNEPFMIEVRKPLELFADPHWNSKILGTIPPGQTEVKGALVSFKPEEQSTIWCMVEDAFISCNSTRPGRDQDVKFYDPEAQDWSENFPPSLVR